MWDSERENASRHAARVRLIITLASSLLALALVGLGNSLTQFPGALSPLWMILPIALGAIGLLCLALSLRILVTRTVAKVEQSLETRDSSELAELADPKLTATYMLEPSEDQLRPAFVAEDDTRSGLIFRTLLAALDLRARNGRERKRIRASERFLLHGLYWTIGAVLAYAVLAVVGTTVGGTNGQSGKKQVDEQIQP